MALDDTLVGGTLALVGALGGSILAHRWESQRDREARAASRAERRADRREDDMRALQDDVTDVQELYSRWAATVVSGGSIRAEDVVEGGRLRQRVWKGVARIGDERLWDLAESLIAETAKSRTGALRPISRRP